MNGFGKFNQFGKKAYYYEGNFMNGLYHGKGSYMDEEGKVFNGTFIRNQKMVVVLLLTSMVKSRRVYGSKIISKALLKLPTLMDPRFV